MVKSNGFNKTLAGAALIFIIYCAICEFYRTGMSAHTGDFHYFYQATRALISGMNLYITAGDGGGSGYIYPPFFAFMITPLAYLSEKLACMVWEVVNLALLVLVLFLGFRVLASGFQLNFNRWQAIGACSLAVLLSYKEVWWEFCTGQCDLFILAGFALSLYWIDRKPVFAGICLGVIANIKYQSLFFLPFLLFRARWRTVMGLIAGAVAAALLPALMIGWNRNLEYLTLAVRGMMNSLIPNPVVNGELAHVPPMLWIHNISITTGLTRIFLDHGWPNSGVLILVTLIAGTVFFLLWSQFRQQHIPFIWRTPRTLGNPHKEKMILNLEWSAILLCLLVFSPQCIIRHLILLLNVNLLAAVMLLFPRPNVQRWPVLVGVLIVYLLSKFDSLHYFGGPCWGYLFFLPLIISSGLAYYRDIYGNDNSPAQSDLQPISNTNHSGKYGFSN